MSDRPNILFLMDDEHRPDVLGYAGNDVVRTPTLDWLAETGVVFENAYTPSPRCVPARQCMAAGQLPRTCGAERWGEGLAKDAMTFARRFAQHAYETSAHGKVHAVGGVTYKHGWGDSTSIIPEADEEAASYETGDVKWNQAKEVQRAGVRDSAAPFAIDGDAHRVQDALNKIQSKFLHPYYDRENPNRPIMMKVSLSKPHYPYFTTEELFTYYLRRVKPFDGEAPPMVDDHPFLGTFYRHFTHADRDHHEPNAVTPREIRRATAAYYGMVEEVDSYYRRVLDALEHVGEDLDEWIIVFTSDHGEMLGQYGLWEKGHFFEGSAGVPLLIRWPERFEPRRVDANVNLCDLFATLCDLAELPLPEDHVLDSRSLVPLLEGNEDVWYDRHPNESVTAYGDRLMIKHDSLKYFYHPEGDDLLLDLDRDEDETTNRIDEPRYTAALDRFETRRAELGYGPDADPGYRHAGYQTGVPEP